MQNWFSQMAHWERQRGYSVYAGIGSHMESSSLLPELLFHLGHVPSCWKLCEAGKQAKGEKPVTGTCDDLHKMQEILAVQYLIGSFLVPAKDKAFHVTETDYCNDLV